MPDDVKNDVAAPSAVAETNQGVLSAETKSAWNTSKLTPTNGDTATPDKSKATNPEEKSESAAESGTAKEQSQEKEPRRNRTSAEERIEQLEATIEKIRKESGINNRQAKAEKQADTATAKPVEVKTEAKREAPKKPIRPKMEDFPVDKYPSAEKAFEAYDAADRKYFDDMDKYYDELRAIDREETIRKFKEETQRDVAQQEFNKYLEKAAERYPNLKEILPVFAGEIHQAMQSLPEQQKSFVPLLDQMINTSGVLADVLMVIAGDAKTKSDFLASLSTNPAFAMRQFIVTEKLVMEELAKASESKGSKTEGSKEEKKTPVEPVKSAPKPVSEVSGKNTAAEDAGQAAARSGDFRTAKSEWTRQALARTRT